MAPGEIKRDMFPYKPLAHPLQSVAHMVFPRHWIKVHPEHDGSTSTWISRKLSARVSAADVPDDPQGTWRRHQRTEVTLDNFFEIFDGLITPEQMEGLKELLRPSPTTWFNHTDHRITEKPLPRASPALTATSTVTPTVPFELGPDSRPNMARLRVDTPTMRGNYNLMQLSSKAIDSQYGPLLRGRRILRWRSRHATGHRSARGQSAKSPIAWPTSTRSWTIRLRPSSIR